MAPKPDPKKKGKKGKKKEKPTGPTVKELQAQIVILEAEKLKEQSERNVMQLERDKIHAFWDIKKEEYEKLQAQLKIKDRYAEELEEKHQGEIKVYNQKMKHLLYEQQHTVTTIKTDNQQALKLQAEQGLQREAELMSDKRDLKEQLKEMELSYEELIRQFRLERAKEITKMRQEFEIQQKEVEDKCEKKIKMLREELELRRKHEIHEIEERKNKHINELIKKHEKAFTEIKCYYNDITKNNLDLIKTLKEDVTDMKKKEALNEKLMHEIAQENKRLTEPLQKALKEVETLRKSVQNYEKDKALLHQRTKQFNDRTKELKALEWEYQALQERVNNAEAERDDVVKKFESSIYEVQQKCGLKNMLLEKKVQVLSTTLEKKETQLNYLAADSGKDAAQIDEAKKGVENLLDSKNQQIKSLRYDIGKMKRIHHDVIRSFELKLSEMGIPLEDMGLPHYIRAISEARTYCGSCSGVPALVGQAV
ncbi:dynein regulatory complex subunit 4 [Marchantia polymorpha subsp. ruderalis]|uniref:Growth arrest-specific protein 8 domain-containing protein n=2 Tax=Marchantia polymorpha TaxID=3197 RepID=A0AAF6BUY6_MARPO|nr:hypothetical protein MARPO_0046s0010 [Marchantia polymorpha]BBN15820.1 hypothetical protein Mp_7g01140 [Marchantia polymorpha subsp. ruderalis]|eukprot:PTQ39185.1 hypothetical protein MARPO_0046s0010 [Marchantia polymorpha]